MKTSNVLALIETAILPFTLAWRGFVGCKLWLWFVVPVFGLRPLRVVEAMGLLLVAHFACKITLMPKRDESEEDKIHRIGCSIAINTIGVAFAFAAGVVIKLLL